MIKAHDTQTQDKRMRGKLYLKLLIKYLKYKYWICKCEWILHKKIYGETWKYSVSEEKWINFLSALAEYSSKIYCTEGSFTTRCPSRLRKRLAALEPCRSVNLKILISTVTLQHYNTVWIQYIPLRTLCIVCSGSW